VNICRIDLSLPFMQLKYDNVKQVLHFLGQSGSYIKDEIWLYPNTSRTQQIFLSNYIVQFGPVVFRTFSVAEFKNIFLPLEG